MALAQCERFFAAHPHLNRVGRTTPRAVCDAWFEAATRRGGHCRKASGKYLRRGHYWESIWKTIARTTLGRPPGPNPDASDRGNKISLVVRLAHRPGALHHALRPFVRRGIDLLRIESRPIKGRPWQYNFYLDLQSPASESELRGALDEIRELAEEVRYLGRYSSIATSNSK